MSKEERYLAQFKIGSREIHAAQLAYFIAGFIISSWAPIIPYIKVRLAIPADVLGFLLLCIGGTAFLTMPISGMLCQRLGCRRLMQIATIIGAVDLVVLTFLPNIICYAVALMVLGAIIGALEVSMNINAVVIEKILKRRMMSAMHAWWSVGCFVAAGLFSFLAEVLGLSLVWVLVVHSLLLFTLLVIWGGAFLAYKSPVKHEGIALPKGIVIVFGFLAAITFLAEGATMDWSGLFLTEVKGIDISLASMGYALFSVAMFAMRLIGDRWVQKMGDRLTITLGSLLAAGGFLWMIVIDNYYLMFVGFILIGIGCANIVPVLYSMLNKQKAMPLGAAITAVTCMGYSGDILGPAFLGFIAHGIGITSVFYIVAGLFIVQMIVTKIIFSRMN